MFNAPMVPSNITGPGAIDPGDSLSEYNINAGKKGGDGSGVEMVVGWGGQSKYFVRDVTPLVWSRWTVCPCHLLRRYLTSHSRSR